MDKRLTNPNGFSRYRDFIIMKVHSDKVGSYIPYFGSNYYQGGATIPEKKLKFPNSLRSIFNR